MGLFRSSKEALGRTGLYHMGVGRPTIFEDEILSEYVPEETISYPFPLNESEIPPDVLCTYGKEKLLKEEIITPEKGNERLLKRKIFYSFDGSSVLSSRSSSHSDLRQDDKTNCKDNDLSKRENIFNFTYNFTKKFQTEANIQ